MLQTIDVLIGFALVMLILSAIVTAVVQWIATTLLNLRGRVLKEGVAHLLRLLDKNVLQGDEPRQIADHILRDTLVGKKKLFGTSIGLAGVIHREELVKLILDFAAGADLEKADLQAKGETDDKIALRAQLKKSLAGNEIVDAGAILTKVRATALDLEKIRPELAADARQTLALIEHASSEFLGKLNSWFDQTIDRTVDTFTVWARYWTVGIAFIVALFLQVDSFQLLQRLSTDKQATATLVNAAITNSNHFASLAKAPAPAPTPTPTATPTPAATPAASTGQAKDPKDIDPADAFKRIENDPDLKQLLDTRLITWPTGFDTWASGWLGSRTIKADATSWTVYGVLAHLLGVLLTVGLLSLGAPIWYEILKNLIGFRSVTARKDDEQRTVRQTNQQSS